MAHAGMSDVVQNGEMAGESFTLMPRRVATTNRCYGEIGTQLGLSEGKIWRRGPGSNRRIKVLQTSPLPLGYRALRPTHAQLAMQDTQIDLWSVPQKEVFLERETGVEPATSSLARKHSTTELLPPCQY